MPTEEELRALFPEGVPNYTGIGVASNQAEIAAAEREAEAVQAHNATIRNQGTTYATTMGPESVMARNERDFMYGRDPAQAESLRQQALLAGQEGRTTNNMFAQQAIDYALPAAAAGAQQALDAGQYGRDAASGIQARGDNVAGYAQQRATALAETGAGVSALGGQYAAGLQGAGAGAAATGASLGNAATQQGQQISSGLTSAAGQAASAGSSGMRDLARAGTGAAQVATQLGQGVAQAGLASSGTGNRQAAALAGAGGAAANIGQQAWGTLASTGGAGAANLYAQADMAGSQAQGVRNRQDVTTNFGAANTALQGATGTATGTQQQLGATGTDMADRAYSNAARLAALEETQGPSAAQALLSQGSQRAINQQQSAAKSGRGLSGSAATADNAGRNIAGIQSDLANQSATLRATEDAAWRSRQAQNLGAAGNLQVGAGSAAGQMQAAGGQLASQTQLAQGAQLGQQAQFGTQSAIQQQAIRDQSAIAYQQQALAATQGAAQTALAGQQAGSQAALAGAGVNVQGLAAGSQAAMAAAGQNLAAQQSVAQTGLAGQQIAVGALGQGVNANLQGQGLQLQGLTAAGSAAQQGTQMGIQATQTGEQQRIAALQAGGALGLQGATAGAGIQQGAGELGLSGMTQGAGIYGTGAQVGTNASLAAQQGYLAAAGYGSGAISQGAGLYNQGLDQYWNAQNTQHQIAATEMQGGIARNDMITRELAIINGASEAEAQARNQMIGYGLQAGATVASAFSDIRAKEDISEVDPIALMATNEEANRSELGGQKPYRYRYKDGLGQDRSPRIGIMADELERSPGGAQVVGRDPATGLKTIDGQRGLSYALAANAGLDKRLRALEER
jgi:hypothetical protein